MSAGPAGWAQEPSAALAAPSHSPVVRRPARHCQARARTSLRGLHCRSLALDSSGRMKHTPTLA